MKTAGRRQTVTRWSAGLLPLGVVAVLTLAIHWAAPARLWGGPAVDGTTSWLRDAGVAGLVVGALSVPTIWWLAARQQGERRTAAFLSQVIEELPVGVAAITVSGSLVVVNRVSRRLGGFAGSEVTAAQIYDVMERIQLRPAVGHGDWLPNEAKPLRRGLAGLDTEAEVMVDPTRDGSSTGSPRRADGPERAQYRLKIQGRSLRAPDGTVRGAVAINYDLTGLHEAHLALVSHRRGSELVAEAVRTVLSRGDGPAAITRAAQQLVDAAGVTLVQPDGHGDLVVTSSTHPQLVGFRVPGGSPSGLVACYRSGLPMWIDDVNTDPRMNQQMIAAVEEQLGRRLGPGVWYPIMADGQCLGVLAIACAEGATAPRDSEALLELLATETALALAHENLLLETERLSSVDPLTGAANRRSWEDALSRETSRAMREGIPLGLLMIDLDHFKRYNDQHGHMAGDNLLRAATTAWRGRLRPEDLLCRWGGEEFAVLLPNCTLHGALAVAEDLRMRMPEDVTCSIGAAEWDRHEPHLDLIARADANLYQAKANGRNTAVG